MSIPSVRKHAHGQQMQYLHQQHIAMVPWRPSCCLLRLDEPCYCYTTEHGIKQVAKVSSFGLLSKDQPTFHGKDTYAWNLGMEHRISFK